MKKHLYSTAPVIFALTLALSFAFIEVQNKPQYFSANSLETLRTLNQKYQFAVEDLSDFKRGAPLASELLHADVLMAEPEANRENTGLLVTLSAEEEQSMLLLQPTLPISDEELSALAEEYEKAIPEFEHVELDQNLEVLSTFYYWPATRDRDLEEQKRGIFNPVNVEVEEEPESEAEVEVEAEVAPVRKERIRVAVIDSGVDARHEIFANNPVGTGWNTISEDDSMFDDVGHGTHIAGIIASEVENAEIIPYKIVDARGGKLSNVVEALSKAIEDDVDVVNMSFGVTSPSYALESLVKKAYEKNIILMAAAGNNGSDVDFYPAHYEHTIAVAGVDTAGNKMPNSNYGAWVDVADYGYHIRSALPDNAYGYKSGTSQATAKATAKVVDLLNSPASNEEWTLEQVLAGLAAVGEEITEGDLAGVLRIK